MKDAHHFFNMIREMARQEGAIIIAPYPREFRRIERDFLNGIRHIPSSISAPQGANPYAFALNRPGRWMMIWIEDDTV